MTRTSDHIRRIARQLGASPVQDTEGVIATLEIARRLVKDENRDPIEALKFAAENMASPKNPSQAFWAGVKAFTTAETFLDASATPLEVMDEAARRQGLVNQAVKKGPK